MRVIKTMRPGERGARRFQRRYGERLCAVRYRQSACGAKVLTTVEIIVDERDKVPARTSHNALHAHQRTQPVALRIAYGEAELRQLIKQAGGRWSAKAKAWVSRRDIAISLGLGHRIVEGLIDACTDIDTSFEI